MKNLWLIRILDRWIKSGPVSTGSPRWRDLADESMGGK